jgi:hypothetical protein
LLIGASTFAEDRLRSARDARLLFDAAVDPSVLVVRARPAGAESPDFDLAVFGEQAAITTLSAGHERVTLSTGLDRISFDVAAGTLLAGPVALELLVPRLSDHGQVFASLKVLLDSVREGRIARRPLLRPVSARRWSASLLGWDARAAGASQRDIASLLHGADRIAREWEGISDSLRSSVRRLLDHADRMVFGGWRDLLRGRM